MSNQLHHLLRLSVRPDLSLRVVPIGHGVHPGRHGGFTLLDYPRHPPVLYREDRSEGVLSDDHLDVGLHRSAAGALTAAALDEPQSRELIGRIAIELYGGHDADGS
jgi:hypothetical protein